MVENRHDGKKIKIEDKIFAVVFAILMLYGIITGISIAILALLVIGFFIALYVGRNIDTYWEIRIKEIEEQIKYIEKMN